MNILNATKEGKILNFFQWEIDEEAMPHIQNGDLDDHYYIEGMDISNVDSSTHYFDIEVFEFKTKKNFELEFSHDLSQEISPKQTVKISNIPIDAPGLTVSANETDYMQGIGSYTLKRSEQTLYVSCIEPETGETASIKFESPQYNDLIVTVNFGHFEPKMDQEDLQEIPPYE